MGPVLVNIDPQVNWLVLTCQQRYLILTSGSLDMKGISAFSQGHDITKDSRLVINRINVEGE